MRGSTRDSKSEGSSQRPHKFELGTRRPVYWISPSVFNSTPAAKPRTSWTLAQVLEGDTGSKTQKARKCNRKHHKRHHHKDPHLNSPGDFPTVEHKQVKEDEIKEQASGAGNSANQTPEPATTKKLTYILNNDPYNVLDISPSSSQTAIKKAFKAKVLGMHPDKGGSPEEFIKLKAAYEVLIDEE